MVGLFPVALFVHNPVMDMALAVAIGMHVHWFVVSQSANRISQGRLRRRAGLRATDRHRPAAVERGASGRLRVHGVHVRRPTQLQLQRRRHYQGVRDDVGVVDDLLVFTSIQS